MEKVVCSSSSTGAHSNLAPIGIEELKSTAIQPGLGPVSLFFSAGIRKRPVAYYLSVLAIAQKNETAVLAVAGCLREN